MKLIQTIIVLLACSATLTGCAPKAGPTISTATGTIAPASGTMTQAQLQARYLATVPAAVRQQQTGAAPPGTANK